MSASAVVLLLAARLRFEGWISDGEREAYLKRLETGEDPRQVLAELERREKASINTRGGEA